MSHPNEDLVRQGYAAFQSGDMATLGELFAADIVWHSPGRNQLSGDYAGAEAVIGLFQKTFELTGGSFKLELHDVVGNDEHVAALVHVEGQRDGKTLSDNSVQVFEIAGGKVTEQWLYPGDPYASDDFWA
ncbi:MAG TPA: nuclear transport factor 2 family protein [Actinomycetota bacterium]|nr:nuclear transport factor 2 family protein [Actinomycetota bacterium]